MNEKRKIFWLLAAAGAATGCAFLIHTFINSPNDHSLMDTPSSSAASAGTVRVAAIQCYSRMGEIDYNRRLLKGLIEKAAGAGAKIIVVPECAVSGYMDPANDIKWTKKPGPDANEALQADVPAVASGAKAEAYTNFAESGVAPTRQLVGAKTDELDANKAAETVPGASTEYFGKLSAKLRVYLCISLIEKDEGELFNTQVLLDPEGKVCGHHRKTILWQPGDGLWATEGVLPVDAIETKYGRLGLMICFEYHALPKLLARERVDIVLYSVGWYAPNVETWYREIFPRNTVVPNGFSIVVANWSAEKDSPGWPGHCCSCVIDSSGTVLAMAKETRGEEIVIADLPVGRATQKKE